jgi:hypothetical protein
MRSRSDASFFFISDRNSNASASFINHLFAFFNSPYFIGGDDHWSELRPAHQSIDRSVDRGGIEPTRCHVLRAGIRLPFVSNQADKLCRDIIVNM